VESSQETLTEIETEISDEDDGTLCSQQSDDEEEGQTVVENGNDIDAWRMSKSRTRSHL